MTRYSDKQPSAWPGHPRKRSWRQVCGRLARHWSQAWHGIAGSTAIRSPAFTRVTAGPVAATTPAPSWPTVNGYWTTCEPIRPAS